jgi:hypothetical protein
VVGSHKLSYPISRSERADITFETSRYQFETSRFGGHRHDLLSKIDVQLHVRVADVAPCVEAGGGDLRSLGVLRRVWIPLLVLVVIGAGGFTVSRLHGIFGSEKRPSYADTKINDPKPFNPKHLTYEIFGPPGTVASIGYFDGDGEPRHIDGASLPWSLQFEITKAAAMGTILAQGDSDSIGCRIILDDEVKAENISNEVNAFTSCLLKSA